MTTAFCLDARIPLLRPYPEYRDSSNDWLCRIPARWTEKPLKRLAAINSDKLPDTTDPDLEIEYVDIGNVTLFNGITSSERLRFEDAPSRARRCVRHGDTIVSTVRTYLKAVAFIDTPSDNLVVSTGFAVLRPRSEMRPRYLFRLAQSEPFVQRVVAHSVGVSYPAINAPELGRFYLPIPPLLEQDAIAAFLDRATARIDTLIARKARLIELLQEKRAALISHAVTKGLDPKASMRNSDTPWLGPIPKHWQTLGLKRMLDSADYGISESLNPTGEVAVLRMGDVQDGEIVMSNLRYVDEVEDALLLRTNDILFNRTNSLALVGKVAIFRNSDASKVSFASYLVRFRTKPNTHPEYLCYLLNRPEILERARALALPAIGQSNLNPNRYGYLTVCLPPFDEQSAIVQHVRTASDQINALVGRVRNGIEKLREYRSALISAAVAGKIDVRREA